MRDPPIRADVAAKSIPFILTVITSGAHLSASLFFSLFLLSLFAISSNTLCAPTDDGRQRRHASRRLERRWTQL